MKVETGIALGFCAVVIGGIVYFAVARKSPMAVIDSVMSGAPVRVTEPEPQAEPKEAVKEKAASVKAAPRRNATAPVVSAADAPEATQKGAQAPAVEVARKPRSAPAATEIPIGIARTELMRRFPDPALQTSTIKDGDLIELVVYQADGAATATFAQLLNGEVTRVYAGVAPRGERSRSK